MTRWRFIRSAFSAGALSVGLLGCIIGTFPEPEGIPQGFIRDGGTFDDSPVGEETCDGIDDDGDGSLDEGCRCDDEVRGCVASGPDGCGFGVQWCVKEIWQECIAPGPPFTPRRAPGVGIVSLSPDSIVHGDTAELELIADPTPACDGVVLAPLLVVLSADDPVMRVRALGRDDGEGADAAASDGRYTAILSNPFGPGVPDQTLRLRVTATVEGDAVSDQINVELARP